MKSAPGNPSSEPVAIIGMSCRFPGGADSPESFWRLLREGFDAMREVPAERWDAATYQSSDPSVAGKVRALRAGFLDRVDSFDASFWGISAREAVSMDPQQRLLLEVTYEALEHALQPIDSLAGSRTGVFVGIATDDYSHRTDPSDVYSGTGSLFSVAAGRISYLLDLRGPSIAVDTACSSSLVALHLACQSLQSRESELAVVGGVNVITDPGKSIYFSGLGALSTDGRCKTFDASADGYGRGEGCGVFVLKRLSEALADGDRVLAVVRGSAVNQDGHSNGLTAPNGLAQEAVLREALTRSGLKPGDIQYVEAHGTGTPLGDPIEIEALSSALCEWRGPKEPLLLGSVKTNIGHLEAAAGVAGLMKVVLAMRHGELPPHLHFTRPNPHVPWARLPLKVPTEVTPWTSRGPRIAGVSSFGISGTNAHVILEEAPRAKAEPEARSDDGHPLILPLSARSPEALTALAEAHRGLLSAPLPAGTLREHAHAASVRRSHHPHRLAVVGNTRRDLAEALLASAHGEPHPGVVRRQVSFEEESPRVAFIFPGQGSQWLGMGRQLLREEPVFREAIEDCERAMRPHVEWSLVEELGADEAHSRLAEIDVVQPVLFAMQVALAALWRSWGIEPDAVVGHSMGEVAAAHVAGALSLEDAARIICRRSRLLRRVSGQGAMAVVELGLEQAREALAGSESRLSVGVSNSARSSVISGDTSALEELLGRLEGRGIFCRRVKVDVASHSPQMDPLKEDLLLALEGVAPERAPVPIYSTVTGETGDGSDFSATYWVRNLRDPVLFQGAIERLLDDGHAVFIEVSPHPVLLAPIQETLEEARRGGLALASLRRQADERRTLLESFAALYVHGHPVEWKRLFPEGGRPVELPSYPWRGERYWLDVPSVSSGASRGVREAGVGHPLLGGSLSSSLQPRVHFWERSVGTEAFPYLADHRVQGDVVFPGAGYVEMALAAGAEVLGEGGLVLEEVHFRELLSLAAGADRRVQLALTEEGSGRASFQILSRAEDASAWRTHAMGRLRLEEGRAPDPAWESWSDEGEPRSSDEHYRRMEALGLGYGPTFRGLRRLALREGEVLGRVQLPEQVAAEPGTYWLHPALLDACLQASVALMATADSKDPFVPVGIERVRLFARPGRELQVRVRARAGEKPGDAERSFDVRLLDLDGRPVAELEGLRARRLDGGAGARDALEGSVFTVAWQRTEALPDALASGTWLVFSDRGGFGEELQSLLRTRGGACVGVVAGSAYERVSADLYRINPASPEDYRRLLRESFGEDGRCQGVVHLLGLDAAAFSSTTSATLASDLSHGAVSATYLAQALVRQGWRDVPRLVLVTRGARSVVEGDAVAPAQASLWGLGQTLATEHPELECTRIDLAPVPDARDASLLLSELVAKGHEDQVALREGRHVARFVRGGFEAAPEEPSVALTPAAGRPFRLELPVPGVLERLVLREARRSRPGPGEVEVEVEATALNFIDVMKAMGIYPGLPPGPVSLGAECSGRIVALGEGVTEFSLGQEVVALAPSCFATHVKAPARFVAPKPARLDFAQAATFPGVFMTAWYAVHHLGRARRGEKILIHSASGGTGLAALQIARALGLEVFATAGSEEKRAFLRSMGVEHVMDSRSLAFADEVMRITDGRGVDLVLNSLTGEALVKSLEVLAPYGRFLELGKRDIYDDVRIGLSPFRKSLSYSAIDLMGMTEARPELFASLFAEVMRHLEDGAFAPLPVHVFPAMDAEGAFRQMAQAKHLGKLAVRMKDPEARIAPLEAARPGIRADASYLITGGLGGLGLSVARWLVEQGARNVALVGRTAPSARAEEVIRTLEAAGARVRVSAADVSREEDVERLLAELGANLPPLRGVVHAAGLLEDHTALELSDAHFHKVAAPKIQGAWNLHARTLGQPLDFFILYSSAAVLLGSPGQGNYAAANAFMDALAEQRRALGLPAMSIQWGAFSEVGLAAAVDARGDRLSYRGVGSLTPAEGITALSRLLEHPRPVVGVLRLDARQWFEFYPRTASVPFFAELPREAEAPRSGSAQGTSLKQALESAPPAGRLDLLEGHLREQLGRVLRIPAARIDRTAPFKSIGVDSLMSLELRNRIEASLGLKLSAALLFTYTHTASLAEHLLERLGLSSAPEVEAAPVEPPQADALQRIEQELDQLSEDELAARLAEKLLLP
ncbi:polyketide synthase [Myxococcus stipitatus DSM 14675]|uniref:Polyketide synthase n=1 Tax=Myxococcus stipitatus (strain DSM 14675 / JCM 12634 / Mx s8) TaxID=1278073 RepID=L7UGQ3_MYXSD|nr:type I polyketide synthase [Myxococcus stipitatus]AGC45624.1 polyketide synthase [Myxococcus stipitatus DSM 14675]